MGQENTQAATAVELAEVIEGLRNELEKAQESGEGKPIRFGRTLGRIGAAWLS